MSLFNEPMPFMYIALEVLYGNDNGLINNFYTSDDVWAGRSDRIISSLWIIAAHEIWHIYSAKFDPGQNNEGACGAFVKRIFDSYYSKQGWKLIIKEH